MTSFLLADPDELRAIAYRIAGHADQVRGQATSLAAATVAARWHSPAANTFRDHAAGIAADLRRAAAELDDAAAAMRRHAEAVGATLGRLAREIGTVVHDVGTVAQDVDRAGGAVVDGIEHAGASALHAIGL